MPTTYTLRASGFRTSGLQGVLQTDDLHQHLHHRHATATPHSPRSFLAPAHRHYPRHGDDDHGCSHQRARISIEFSKPMDPATFTSRVAPAEQQQRHHLRADSGIFWLLTGRYIADSTHVSLRRLFRIWQASAVGSQISVNLDTRRQLKILPGILPCNGRRSRFPDRSSGPNTTPPAIGGFSPRNGDEGGDSATNAQIM